MFRNQSLTFVANLLVGFLFSTSFLEGSETHLLSIGIEPKLTRQKKYDLYSQDAAHVEAAFKKSYAPSSQLNTTLLNGKKATRSQTIVALETLASKASADDVTVIFFSCHGDIDKKKGYFFTLAPEDEKKKASYLFASEFHDLIDLIPGEVIVMADTCEAGGLIEERRTSQASFIVASMKGESSYGQEETTDLPHGYFVLALCEALTGLADTDGNKSISLKEAEIYLKTRTGFMCKEQTALSSLHASHEKFSLGRVKSNRSMGLNAKGVKSRNPFGYQDIKNPFDTPVKTFIKSIRYRPHKKDPNADDWVKTPLQNSPKNYDGAWSARWKEGEGKWHQGRAWLTTIDKLTFICFQEGGNEYLFELRRLSGNRLGGRYLNLHDNTDTGPWIGHLASKDRIDGFWADGRWDLKR